MRAAPVRLTAEPRAEPGPGLGILCVAAALGLVFVGLRFGLVGDTPPAPTMASAPAVQAPPAEWIPIARPAFLFGLAAPELHGLPLVHGARRHREGGREDILVWGAFANEGLHLRLSVRAGEPAPPGASFFIDLVRRAAEAGFAVTRAGVPDPIATKFGTAEAADVVVEEAAERDCLAFRADPPDTALHLRGWLCGSGDRPADRQSLACLLDRLSLREGHDDPALRAAFAAAEERRLPACAGRTSWLEMPPLRGSLGSGAP